MPVAESFSTARITPDAVVPTHAANNLFLSVPGRRTETAWQLILDRFIDWGRSPGEIDEDGWESPSLAALEAAYKLLGRLRDQDAPPPRAVVPNGEGGIIFERGTALEAEAFEIDASGSAEYRRFVGDRLLHRQAVMIR